MLVDAKILRVGQDRVSFAFGGAFMLELAVRVLVYHTVASK